jgi:SHS2 domain-containing protein
MRRYRFIDHTGDVGVMVYGRSLAELFQHAGESFSAVLTDPRTVVGRESRFIEVQGSGLESVLVAWLSELLFLFDTGGWLFSRFEVVEVHEGGVKARVWGERYDEERHPIKTVVKAVTFHQLSVRQEQGRWMTQIVYDI